MLPANLRFPSVYNSWLIKVPTSGAFQYVRYVSISKSKQEIRKTIIITGRVVKFGIDPNSFSVRRVAQDPKPKTAVKTKKAVRKGMYFICIMLSFSTLILPFCMYISMGHGYTKWYIILCDFQAFEIKGVAKVFRFMPQRKGNRFLTQDYEMEDT